MSKASVMSVTFNKIYHARARRSGDFESVGKILRNLLRHPDADARFYRPERQTPPGKASRKSGGKIKGIQLELNFEPEIYEK